MTYKNKPKTVKRMVIATYILINVSGLHAPTKRNRSQGTQMLESADTAFKLAVISIF